MSEQKRVFLAVLLVLLIAFGWQWLMGLRKEQAGEQAPEPPTAAAPAKPEAKPTPPAPKAGEQPKEEAAKEVPGPAEAAAPTVARPVSERKFSTELFSGSISSTGALTGLSLADYTEKPEKDAPAQPVSLVTGKIDGKVRQAHINFDVAGKAGPPLDFIEGGQGFTLAGENPKGVRVEVVAVPRSDAYAIDYQLRVHNGSGGALKTGARVTLALAPVGKGGGGLLTPRSDQVSGLCATDDTTERYAARQLENPEKTPAATWGALDRQYFVVAVAPKAPKPAASCEVSANDSSVLVDYVFASEELPAGGTWQRSFALYAGPKRQRDLEAVAPQLTEVINYNIWHIPLGFLARPMVYLLNIFHSWTASWGLAIILLTLLVKLVLFPVTYKSVSSMRRMQLLKPELDKIKKQYEGDRERLQMEQLKLFREKGVNPLGGCLPMLLQMPVWFALYRTLWTAVDLYQQHFLWIDDLTRKESFPFLALAFGVLTVVQQRITPSTMDNQQAKVMMYVMPLMFTLLMFSLPSGLVLYIVVNSILTIVQQLVINRRLVAL